MSYLKTNVLCALTVIKKVDFSTSIAKSHIISKEGDMLIYIVKGADGRYLYLYKLLKLHEECEYSNSYPPINKVNQIILPLDGIDEFGIIKHTILNLEKIIKENQIECIYTGKINNKLIRLCQLYQIKLYSFYDDINYLNEEKNLMAEVIKIFLEEKLSTKFTELKVLVLKDDNYKTFKKEELDEFDAIINFSNMNLEFFKEKIIIEMKDIKDIDLTILLNCKKIYLINQLLKQYLTKSGGKILYDSMVKR